MYEAAEPDASGLLFSSFTPPPALFCDGDGDAKVGLFTGENSGVCLLLGGDRKSADEGDAPFATGVVVAVEVVPARRFSMPPAPGLGLALRLWRDLWEPAEPSCPAEWRAKMSGTKQVSAELT